MAKTVPLDARTLDWAHRIFQRYYAEAAIPAPSRLARREFAAFPFTEQVLMRRHASFRTPEQFHDFLVREAPRHVYYSSAYYKQPDHPTMPGKEWLGADLIFDLDADHLRGAESLSYADQLARVRDRTRELFDDFLVRDFGIDPGAIGLVFSGGRGYHLHVHDPAFWPMSSPERRELVDYIQGGGFDATDSVREDRGGPASAGSDDAATHRAGSRAGPAFKRLYPPDTPGWRGRATRALLTTFERWDSAGWETAATEMERMGLPKAEARRLARELVLKGRGKDIRETLSLEVFRRAVPEEFVATVLRAAAIEVQGETDAPVTTDIHRLIRLPGSIHGGTGFRVVPLDRAALERFDPWKDALI
ncbi:MAG TPA: DNA primase small subunit PriS, partial [Thermoplasmata archaeon]|nr:DNA primase small subunit PriS [Thermoplasmata archaeon]